MKQQAGWNVPFSGGSNISLVKAAQAGRQHIVFSICVSIVSGTGVPAISIKDGSTTVWVGRMPDVVGGFFSYSFPHGLPIARGNSCTLVSVKTSGTQDINIHGITQG